MTAMNAKPDYEVNAELEQLRLLLRRMNEEYGPWVLLEEVRRLANETDNGQDALTYYAGVDRARVARPERADDAGGVARQRVIRKRPSGGDAWDRAVRASDQPEQARPARGDNDAVAEARRLLGG